MSEKIAPEQEHKAPSSAQEVFARISAIEPKPIQAFVPENGEEVKALFLSGEVRNPVHTYSRLAALTPGATGAQIAELATEFSDTPPNTAISYEAYLQYATRAQLGYELLQAAQDVHSTDQDIATAALERYKSLNEVMYGAPDEGTYRSLLRDAIAALPADDPRGESDELRALIGNVEYEGERFTPSTETVQFMQGVAEYLYGGMVAHIPSDKEKFSPQDIASVFEAVIREEFGEAASDWRVEVTKAQSVNVVASEKTIRIPENRAPITYETLRGLVVHELGVHMLRSLTGSSTDLAVLSTGLSDYYDSEEGLGKVMEQAINGTYKESGVDYYLIVGMMYFDNKDFRDVHDVLWRMQYLRKPPVDDHEKAIATAKDSAYKAILRITRGTDSAPFLKDLAYYNGAASVWSYAEQHRGDYEHLSLLTLGKADPSKDEHRRILLETRSI